MDNGHRGSTSRRPGSNESPTEYLVGGGLRTGPLDGPAAFRSKCGGLSSRMHLTALTLSNLGDGGEVLSSVSSSSSFSSELSLYSWSLSSMGVEG